MKNIVLNASLLLSLCLSVVSCSEDGKKHVVKKNEKYYQTKMCNELKGEIEFVLPDKTRVDCLTDMYAIEVDWAQKWAEGVGQSIYYAETTDKKPAVALIIGDSKSDERHYKRLVVVGDKLNIRIFRLKK